ncbi:MAG TPA: hypothetical protein VF152_13575 [Acidimicrobiia bacterium]
MGTRVASAVWRIAPELVLALDAHLGAPVDSYVNGSQTWLTDDGPGGVTLEWRLHPTAGYRLPAGLSHYELWEQVVSQLAGGRDPGALALGDDRRPLASLWDGLEVFAPHDDLEPATLARAGGAALGRPPDATGLVDHDRIGDAWERAKGGVSIVALLLDELQA